MTNDYPTLKIKIAREQGGIGNQPPKCAFCGEPGATDLHHWLLKRSSGLPAEVINVPINVVLLHHRCHMQHGQTKAMTQQMFRFKKALGYDVEGWLKDLQSQGIVKCIPK
jgi:hypothetical protein